MERSGGWALGESGGGSGCIGAPIGAACGFGVGIETGADAAAVVMTGAGEPVLDGTGAGSVAAA
jgi:hypothetical protein